jgi:DHA1 family multidrug resistance protein-like MFS transporter
MASISHNYGSGILRTSSGRMTYHPDGIPPDMVSIPDTRSRPETGLSSESDTTLSPGVQELSSSNGAQTPLRMSQHDESLERSLGSENKMPSDSDYSPVSTTVETNFEKELQTSDTHSHLEGTRTGEIKDMAGNTIDQETDVEKQETHGQRPEESGEEKDPNLVDWDGPDDCENAMNFPTWRKWLYTAIYGSMTFCITFASTVFSTATVATAKEFDVSVEVMTLGTSLFVAGFAIGPIIWGPLSELYGRRIPLFIGFFLFALFQIPVAVARNVETIMICRFLGGVFGSSPLAVVAGSLADMFHPVDRGIAVCVFSGATFIGPIAGPIAGGFITMSHLTWRWTEYLTSILAFGFGLIGFIVIPETYGPVLLQRRAKKLRYQTRNWAMHSKLDEEQVDMKQIIHKYLFRPFAMLILEPILLLVTIYMSLTYGILYLFFEAYPITFTEQRGWNIGVGALPFSALTIGVIMGVSLIVYTSKTRFARAIKLTGHVVPEERLIPMMVGGGVFPIGLFWFAWTSNPHMTWVPQVLAGIPIGMGVQLIFLQGLNYIIDVYTINANSAISANTFVRSLLGAGFPMFAAGM